MDLFGGILIGIGVTMMILCTIIYFSDVGDDGDGGPGD